MSAFKKRRREFETPECVSCGSDNVVTDTKQGHMVCDDCGVILEASMISASTEYRNFSESDKPTGECALRWCWAHHEAVRHYHHTAGKQDIDNSLCHRSCHLACAALSLCWSAAEHTVTQRFRIVDLQLFSSICLALPVSGCVRSSV